MCFSKISVVLLLGFASVFASFGDYRSRDSERFSAKTVKPFHTDQDVVAIIMREGIPRGGGYTYQYPRENPEPFMTDKYAVQGDLSMEIELIASDYSGVAIAIAGSVDLLPYMEEGVLELSIKGDKGGEVCQYVVLDDGVKTSDDSGESLQLKIGSKSFGDITTEWQRVSVPLKLFGNNGVYWDGKNQREIMLPFNWDRFKGFRIEVRKDENKEFKVWIDDIVIKKVGEEYKGPEGYPFRNVL
ncbi:hypothetical protein AGMMS49938_01330 [Fibrobacterales bacterium]|nr:hypothetical protein AGMMS49938_01330 [Fibrobacterales bacterium]